jgi:hypothetical protein
MSSIFSIDTRLPPKSLCLPASTPHLSPARAAARFIGIVEAIEDDEGITADKHSLARGLEEQSTE